MDFPGKEVMEAVGEAVGSVLEAGKEVMEAVGEAILKLERLEGGIECVTIGIEGIAVALTGRAGIVSIFLQE